MERNQANEVWRTWRVCVPVQYKGEINLQAALLLLFTWDEEKQELLNQRCRTSFASAARALGCTEYKLKKLIQTFERDGMQGVKMMNFISGRNRRVLNITERQVAEICSREVLTKHATYSLFERCTIYNDMWKGQECNLKPADLSKFYKGAGITLQRY